MATPLPDRLCRYCRHSRLMHRWGIECLTDGCQCAAFEPYDELAELRTDLALRAGSVAVRAAYAFGDWPPAEARS